MSIGLDSDACVYACVRVRVRVVGFEAESLPPLAAVSLLPFVLAQRGRQLLREEGWGGGGGIRSDQTLAPK